ncbi:MAG TPA: trehalose-phosphatase [Gemmatimonadaceae bacterium]|jgi:trehalose-phosphatase
MTSIPALPITPALSARLKGTPLLLLLDIDGTLSPLAPRPDLAFVPAETQALLRDLAATHGVDVVFVTGRSAADARRLVGIDNGWVIGNHGMELAAPCEPSRARDDVAPFEGRVADATERVTRLASERGWGGVLVEDKRLTASVHYRLSPRDIVPEVIAQVSLIGTEAGLRVTQGKEVLELRPPIAVDKGTEAVKLAESLGALGDEASVLAAGDDRTDEDLFRVLRQHQPRAVTVRVGDAAATEAEFVVPDADAMRELLLFLRRLR